MRCLRDSVEYVIEYSGFSHCTRRYSDANWIFDSDETNLLVVIDSHLGWCEFMEISQKKQLLLDQQEIWVCCSWEGLIVKLS